MFKRSLVAAFAATAMAATLATAQPIANLTPGFSFVDWTTVNNAQIGRGFVDDDNVVYFAKEKQVGDFQSWLLFFDPTDRVASAVTGTITFDGPIASVFTTKAAYDASTAIYGLASINYGTSSAVAFEANDPQDFASFAGNVLTFGMRATDPGDHIRILTRAVDPNIVPEPASAVLRLAGLGGLGIVARRRRA